MLTKILNFFNWPLTTNEIIWLLKEHMMKVCNGRYGHIYADDLTLVDLKTLLKLDFVIVYEWDGLFWEVDFQRNVSAYSKEIVRERYEGSSMEKFATLEGLYVCVTLQRKIFVSVKGNKASKLKLKRKSKAMK